MCTVTVIPVRGLPRLVSNRDELRTRPASSLPREHTAGDARTLWPVDPTGGGTWVGGNDRGVAMSLLNLNLDPHPALPNEPVSRGLIMPHALRHNDARSAIDAVDELELARMNCFRLVAADAQRVLCARWDRQRLTVNEWALEPVCFASSGLGDHLVQGRLPLWDEMVSENGPTPETQDAFHAHSWPDRGFASVLMDREEARTTSTTIVEVRESRLSVTHRDDDGWHGAHTLELSSTAKSP